MSMLSDVSQTVKQGVKIQNSISLLQVRLRNTYRFYSRTALLSLELFFLSAASSLKHLESKIY